MTKYIALLRKINVGGKNLIQMNSLRDVCEGAGLKHVRTFQQAGNIVFEGRGSEPRVIANKLEKRLARVFNADLREQLFSHLMRS